VGDDSERWARASAQASRLTPVRMPTGVPAASCDAYIRLKVLLQGLWSAIGTRNGPFLLTPEETASWASGPGYRKAEPCSSDSV
jgi:hypothetical protein